MPRTAARVSAASLVALASSALAQPSFRGLGDLSGGAFESNAWRVSDDGAAIVGTASIGSGSIAQRITAIDGMARLGRLAGLDGGSDATAVSATGRVVVGQSWLGADSEAFLWTADSGMIGLGDLAGGPHASQAYGVSPDGSVVVGVADFVNQWPVITGQAFRWTASGGMQGLGFAEAHHDYSSASAASADGGVITGISFKNLSDGEAFIWTEATGMVGLGDISGGPDTYSLGSDITPDGTVIVGCCSPADGYEAFRWTQATGMIPLGDLPGNDHYSYASGVSADGNVIVGAGDWDGGLGGARAFIWDADHGMRNLQSVLENDYGLDLTGWTLLYAQDVSADGLTIVGQGINPNGDLEAWVASLKQAPCPADFNGDGVVNTIDVLGFLNAWVSGC
ncbi:MAG: PEP-CTERM sorting domain-containing protein [Phycisphaerales bacterium]|nr:PEP-CTERM sorting domain-containing protein [Phycisphaerales bacterium]